MPKYYPDGVTRSKSWHRVEKALARVGEVCAGEMLQIDIVPSLLPHHLSSCHKYSVVKKRDERPWLASHSFGSRIWRCQWSVVGEYVSKASQIDFTLPGYVTFKPAFQELEVEKVNKQRYGTFIYQW
jgi:hypothetical protein